VIQPGATPFSSIAVKDFCRFISGQEIDQKCIAEILKTYGIQGEIRTLRYGYYKKIVVWVQGKNPNEQVIKLAFHPYSIFLMQQEAKGYQACRLFQSSSFCLPKYELIDTPNQFAIAILEKVRGGPAKIWQFPKDTFTRLGGVKKFIPLAEYLRQENSSLANAYELAESWKKISEKILNHFNDRLVPISFSHGDFIYWNMLRYGQGKSHIIDLEYFSSKRSACFDDWHWFLFPLARKAIKIGQEDSLVAICKRLPTVLWFMFLQKRYPRCEFWDDRPLDVCRLLLILYFYEQSLLFFSEHQLPNILSLIGTEAYQTREAIQRLYLRMIERLIS